MALDAVPVQLSVVVPTYNEERMIGETLRRIDAYLSLKGLSWEVLVCSDGSRDRTDSVVRAFAEAHPSKRVRLLATSTNRGKGAAVRRGALEAAGERVLVTDTDLSAPIKECDKLAAALDAGFDVAIGSRALRSPGCDVRQSWKRRLSGRIFNLFVRAICLRGFRDTQCGFKLFTRRAARELFGAQTLDGFSFDVEVLYLALRKGFRVKEVPVMWSQGPTSQVRLVRDSVGMLGELVRIRRHYRRHPAGKTTER